MPRLVWLLAPASLVAAIACGHSGPAAAPAASHAAEITYHLADSGRQVTVNVGDRLSLNLGSSSDRHWVLGGFPRALFSAPVEHPRGDFTFTVLAPGNGQVAVLNTFACPAATVHGCSKPERGNVPSGSPVPAVFSLTVHVR
jgi:hypothetical protein